MKIRFLLAMAGLLNFSSLASEETEVSHHIRINFEASRCATFLGNSTAPKTQYQNYAYLLEKSNYPDNRAAKYPNYKSLLIADKSQLNGAFEALTLIRLFATAGGISEQDSATKLYEQLECDLTLKELSTLTAG